MTHIVDPYTITNDAKMTFLDKALEPTFILQKLQTCLGMESNLKCIEVKRYKAERRCLIAYAFADLTVLAKVRAKGLDQKSYETQRHLYTLGFPVPQVLGVIPELHMWLQDKLRGQPLTNVLQTREAPLLMTEVAETLAGLHSLPPVTRRQHTIDNELTILCDCLARVAKQEPLWSGRLEKVSRACEAVAAALPHYQPRGIHRDFYADQVLVDGSEVYLLDFDLYTLGDPALDVGNFLGHLTEIGLRLGNAELFQPLENTFEASYLEQNGEVSSQAIQLYKTLTLARHIFISTQFEERKKVTERLLELCEERLGLVNYVTSP
jgi:aminoglycoside phosphotransferase (APT) family kinase protein